MKKSLFILLTLLSSCQVGPRYQLPSSAVPSSWKTVQPKTLTASHVEHWWDIFHDRCLDELEKKAISCNYDLYVALEKVEEARAVAGVNKADLYPQVALNGGYSYIQDQVHAKLSKKAKTLGFLEHIQIRDQTYQFPNILSYELDLWQKYRGQYKSALFNVQAQQEHARGVLLTLTTELASNYFNLRALDSQIRVIKEALAVSEDMLRFHKARYATGLDNYLDVATAEKNLSLLEAEYEEFALQRMLFEHAIAVLTGTPPSEFNLPEAQLGTHIPAIPAGIPSLIMKRRPDIAQAERTMAAKHSLINVAYSSFFPALDLTAGLGFSSIQLKHFLSLKNYLFDFGVNLIQSVLDAGRNRSNLEAAKARFREAEGSYQQLVLKAFQEVENALSAVKLKKEQSKNVSKAYFFSQKIAALSKRRYETGVVNELEVLNNKKALLEVNRLMIQTTAMHYQATLGLIKSLGGSWEDSDLVQSSTKEKRRANQHHTSNDNHWP